MTSLLTRLGSRESRLVSQTIWTTGKRKRTGWICAECKARRALRQRRAYGDDTLKITAEQYIFPPRDSEIEASEDPTETKCASWAKRTLPWRPFGVGIENDAPRASETQTRPDGVADADDPTQTALWESFERVEDGENDESIERIISYANDTASDSALLDIDYVSGLSQALANNEPDMVARCLYAAERKQDLDFIRSLPRTTFVECIRILQPSNFLAPLATAHMEMSDAVAKQLGLSPIQEVAWQYGKILRDVLKIRRSAGVNITLVEYKMLLRSAHDLGNKRVVNYIWHLLLSDGLTPDTACYNSMMAANLWNGVLQSQSRHKVRVTQFFQLARQTERPSIAFSNYRVGVGGLKEQVMHVFSDMLKHGAIADEESFRNVIMAAAREGDLSTVKSVLRKVWGIDVDALSAGKDEAMIPPKPIDPNSPLRPTSKLLFALAHAFGVNNDVPTALRVVDFVARSYDITIDLEVWNQLFEWTFVLATPRHGVNARTDDTMTGQLPKPSVLKLWETMTGPPYFIKPTAGMYNHLIKNLQHRESPSNLYHKMCEGWELYHASMKQANRAFTRLERAVQAENQVSSPSREVLRKEWEYFELIRKRNYFWCKRWLRLLLSTLRSFNRVDKRNDWALREMPRILWEWRRMAPAVVRYDTLGGLVELERMTEEEIQDKRRLRDEKQQDRAIVLEKVPTLLDGWVNQRRPATWTSHRVQTKGRKEQISNNGEIPRRDVASNGDS